jgi:hypothetical protein
MRTNTIRDIIAERDDSGLAGQTAVGQDQLPVTIQQNSGTEDRLFEFYCVKMFFWV